MDAAVLFLHGGRADDRTASRSWHLAALRMKPFVRATAAALDGAPVLLAEVRYRVRGWNGDDADALLDARSALAELGRLAGDVPVVLVGHSMGGRAALLAAAAPNVTGVLALAPWCPPSDPVSHLDGKRVTVLHGDRDRVTDPQASVEFTHRARTAGASVETRLVPGGDHAMLRGRLDWHRAAASIVIDLLGEAAPSVTRKPDPTGD
ncbi:alpha/beta hydrolase [Streptomyces xanthii]|uniref:alpha/beta hydrolase n=1 Tax=Streptomyces xanthii TaxID=2768069 RepID=UPI002948BBF6|nr:alpha/beta fold hydrolase [Streptomyces xanthii]